MVLAELAVGIGAGSIEVAKRDGVNIVPARRGRAADRSCLTYALMILRVRLGDPSPEWFTAWPRTSTSTRSHRLRSHRVEDTSAPPMLVR